jgi:hypothetical protein
MGTSVIKFDLEMKLASFSSWFGKRAGIEEYADFRVQYAPLIRISLWKRMFWPFNVNHPQVSVVAMPEELVPINHLSCTTVSTNDSKE